MQRERAEVVFEGGGIDVWGKMEVMEKIREG